MYIECGLLQVGIKKHVGFYVKCSLKSLDLKENWNSGLMVLAIYVWWQKEEISEPF